MAPPPCQQPVLMDELIEQFLLRLPPAEPTNLVCAALVCKRWCRLVSDHGFRRRFREFHRTPPMLGFLCNLIDCSSGFIARFVPTSSSCTPHTDHRGWRARDSRHGRVLLHTYPTGHVYASFRLVVWDPTTGEWLELPKPPRDPCSWTAAVLCAAVGACDHLNCHRGPFVVVLVGTDDKEMFACVYSSESGAWSEPTSAKHPGDRVSWARSALVGNALYFVFEMNDRILEYDLGTREMPVMQLPAAITSLVSTPYGPIELMAMEDGRLGFARVQESRLCIWSKDVEDAGWTLSKDIELEKLLPLNNGSPTAAHDLVGFADGIGLVFVKVEDGIFTVDLKSGRTRKVCEGSYITSVVPYVNFCTPGTSLSQTS
ncbi:uncharacterized protein LOC133892293 [Phragmites australis]|uniref:uncharacterized protein LOC133892293 n=1 Tax=Phragmites australis TaxID=29695 RepID=UPI002D77DC5C|nr:uncharacterized protein LOC133892293 [Phragmites australis]